MAFQVSPGINTSEVDLTTVIPSVPTTEGAIAGVFKWGPMDERILVSSEIDLANRFGQPDSDFNAETFFTAADFLAYGNQLFVVRVGANTATSSAAANTVAADAGEITAKYAGSMGDSLKVELIDAATFGGSATYDALFDEAPDGGHVHIAVVDEDGMFTGTANTVLETFTNISTTAGAKTATGQTNYIINVLNQRSNYIAAATDATGWQAGVASLSGGADGDDEATIAVGTVQAGYDLFVSPEEVEISLILQGKARGTANDAELGKYIIENIAEVRKDCLAFVSPARADVVDQTGSSAVTNVTGFRTDLALNSSYGVMDSGYKYRYDKYNDQYIYTPLNGDVAGTCVYTDDVRDPWYSPAGYSRGNIKNVIKLAFNPTKAQRDQIYKKGINPVVIQAGAGTVLLGDKTLQPSPSSFDRINVRRLFIVLEKAISRAAITTLFEFNDEFTRAQFTNLVEPFLRDVQGRRGITDFRVVCDSTNNTQDVIDRNEFIGDIYVKPARAINFIQLNFVSVRTGVEFEEIVGRF